MLERLEDAAARERLLAEARADVGQDAGLHRVVLVEEVLERRVGRAEAVEEVLRKDPPGVGVRRLLDRELRAGKERVVGEDVFRTGQYGKERGQRDCVCWTGSSGAHAQMSDDSLMIWRMLASEGGPWRGCRYSETTVTPLRKFSTYLRVE